MTTLTLELTKKEKKTAANAKWRAANPEKVKAAVTKWQVANPEKLKVFRAKWVADNSEKIKVAHAKWYAKNAEKKMAADRAREITNPMTKGIRLLAKTFKTSHRQLKDIVPQELIELKLLQLTLFRLIQEKGKLK